MNCTAPFAAAAAPVVTPAAAPAAATAADTAASAQGLRHGAVPKRSGGLPAAVLAVVMTLAMLGGIDRLATGSASGANAAAVQMAKAAAPRA